MYSYKLYEDNGGFLHLAVLDSCGHCVYYLCDNYKPVVKAARDAIRNGGDPIADDWSGGVADPQGMYFAMLALCDARNGSAWVIDEG